MLTAHFSEFFNCKQKNAISPSFGFEQFSLASHYDANSFSMFIKDDGADCQLFDFDSRSDGNRQQFEFLINQFSFNLKIEASSRTAACRLQPLCECIHGRIRVFVQAYDPLHEVLDLLYTHTNTTALGGQKCLRSSTNCAAARQIGYNTIFIV